MTSTAQPPVSSPQGTGSTAGQYGAGWLPVPESSLGPVIPERGYLVEEIRDGLYWVTEGMYQCAFMVTGYDFDTLIGGHLTRLGRREDVETQREYVLDLRREALRALAEVDQLPSWQYVHNVYGMFTNHFNRIASEVAEELLPKWKGRLAGVDFFIHNHSFIMLEALRVDWNAEPFVVLPPPALITEDS